MPRAAEPSASLERACSVIVWVPFDCEHPTASRSPGTDAHLSKPMISGIFCRALWSAPNTIAPTFM